MESISNLVFFEIITYGSISTVMYNKENKKKPNDCNKIYRFMYIDQSQFLHFSDWNLPFVMSCIDFWLIFQFKLRNENKKAEWHYHKRHFSVTFTWLRIYPLWWIDSTLDSILISKLRNVNKKAESNYHKRFFLVTLLDWETETQNELTWLKFRSCSKYFVTFFHYSCVPYLEL